MNHFEPFLDSFGASIWVQIFPCYETFQATKTRPTTIIYSKRHNFIFRHIEIKIYTEFYHYLTQNFP